METNVTNWQRRQNANNNFSAIVPYDMELQRKETKEMLDDLTTRDQRMMFGILTMVHLADSKKQLDSDTELLAFCLLCQLVTLVSTPSSRFWISLTASSVGTGRMSIDNIREKKPRKC